ncbi:anaerobic ribonucleoside-triphosphate reductase activating protein [Halomonas alimentaria]|uniref:Anaerobic ribonucleoside-triphosphate reductase activating protein n=1 Tax=Halomonas alimentaria TaxID=147248 RepID=A0A7X5AQF5_9GAMM|nr:anaerobic ribonucleoside-triphosphate reductase activating protein [Halomonas alimentaria]NAW34412.1 anaerobic ribonucleoside-triphosphate reductase activating protein [Halomonas alimentaria]
MVIPLVPEPGAAIRLPIAGFEARDDHAFPGRRSALVYLQGCPLQCGYCETASSMGPARRAAAGEWDAIEGLLAARVGELDAVVFSGGEPTLHPDLPAAADACRSLGLAVGLHTAGPYPERLERLLPRLDWVALDTKGRGADFDRVAGRPGIWRQHALSLSLLLEAGVPFECRTTLHWRDFSLDDLELLAMTLADCGVRRYAIQLARLERCLDPAYRDAVEDAPPREALETLIRRLRRHFAQVELRG